MSGFASAERACPVCGATDSERAYLGRDAHYGIAGEWWIRRCASCASVFLESPPTADELAAMYADSYYSYALTPRGPLKTALQQLLRYSKAPREPVFAQPGRVLDFGCGAGEQLLAMRSAGWQCAGVEISEVGRARAAELGLDVRPALVGEGGFAPASFDYVRANHSLEHVLRPDETLRDMLTVLKPGGTLFLGVPTTSSENARLFGASWWHLTAPLHTFVPSTKGLRDLLERTGFRVTKMWTNGDYTGVMGSLQIRLNRGTTRRSYEGVVFAIRPLLLLGHWWSKLQDVRGVGDKLELVAVKPG